MEFLQLIASSTQRATIVSSQITDHFQVPPFAQGDLIEGKVVVFNETGNPAAPTAPFNMDGCTGVALTNGRDVIYCTAGGSIVVTGNIITFTLDVSGTELEAMFADDDWLDAFFEVRVSEDGQDGLLLREAVTIERAATGL